MPATYTVHVDEALQVIRTAVDGDIVETVARGVGDRTEELARNLADPSRVRILMDARKAGRMDSRARKIFAAQLRKPEFAKLAMVGAPGYVRAVVNFVCLVAGVNKVRAFQNEQQALGWLNERPAASAETAAPSTAAGES